MTLTRKMLITRGSIARWTAVYFDLLSRLWEPAAQDERIVVLGYIGGLRRLYMAQLRKLRQS